MPGLSSWFGNLFSKKSYPYGTSGSYSEDLSKLPKWVSLLSRHNDDMQHRAERAASNPKFGEWLHFIDTNKTKALLEKFRLVNDWTNTAGFIPDSKNWKVNDYWATPYELFTKGGDCEDYAAAKYLALRMMGVSTPDLRLVVLDDTHRNANHAILVAYAQNASHMLDNQIKNIVAPETVSYYKPVYSVNEKGWWVL